MKARYAKEDMDSRHGARGKSATEYKAQRRRYDKKHLTLQEYTDKWGSAPKENLRKKK